VKSFGRFWLIAAAVVLASLTPKAVVGVLRARAAAPTPPNEQLRAFLLASSGGPVTPILAKHGPRDIVGWRFGSGECVVLAFLSGLPGSLDAEAHAHAPPEARISYIYRGVITERPPRVRLALDVMAFRSLAEFSPARTQEPRYVVLVTTGVCPKPPSLPWNRLRLN
jgi:hypothetical protein